ncbi:MAG: DUF5658 family protein [Candidatus Scalindua rubra]|nr:DUF5658 family protein [Candidatus Scalindua rubra]TWU38030.1 hypothetical protein S225a_00760 [Candidatus Brocadiaceae bacterium S225]
MKLQSTTGQDKNRSDSSARRQDEGLPGLWYLFFGRRKGMRRHEDNQESYFLDHYSLRVFGIIISIILLSLTDAMLTLYLIRNGAAEVNPIMEHFLRYGTLPFLAAKYLLTTASIVLLLIYKNVHIFGTKIRAKYLFVIILLIFASVVLWELYLILFVLK